MNYLTLFSFCEKYWKITIVFVFSFLCGFMLTYVTYDIYKAHLPFFVGERARASSIESYDDIYRKEGSQPVEDALHLPTKGEIFQ